jgi:ubiquinone/menaquinone biosynthesis C-methylase UbiE/GNAT superfamily N-acetyltransferase
MMDDKQKSRKYFDSHSSTFVNRNGYWNYDYRVTSRILKKRNAKKLIDIGCGNGAFLEMFYMQSPGTELAGLDLSHEMVLRSRERLPEAEITEGDAEQMPFKDGAFDAASCHMSIHHHPHPEKSLAEMYRILMNNGTVVINELTGPKLLRRFMNWCFTKWPTGDHAIYSRTEMEEMLHAAGFQNIRSRMITPFSYVSVGRKTEKKAAMIKLAGLSEEQVTEISRRIADAFFDYEYHEEDIGLIKFISTREDMFTYMNAIVRAAYKSGVLYTTSDRQEGYLMLSGEGADGSIGFMDGMKMIMAEKQALGGVGNMKKFICACFFDGGTIETRMRKAKRKFLRIEMLVVRKEYQGQGFMRKMMEFTYHLADKKHVPVILDTDDKDKAARYEHLGMKLDRVRSCGERFHMYDLIRE